MTFADAPARYLTAAQPVRAKINHQDVEAMRLEIMEAGRQIEKVTVEFGGPIFSSAVDHDDGFRASGAWNPPSRELDCGVARWDAHVLVIEVEGGRRGDELGVAAWR